MSDDPNAPQTPEDHEHFGEASLGEAQADEAPSDPEMLSDGDGETAPDSDAELTDLPAIEPAPGTAEAIEEEAAAAAEAGAIGGAGGAEGVPESERPLAESGEGEAEGFEQAEEALVEAASHGDPAGNPIGDRFTPEEAASEDLASYGEADHVKVSEDDQSDEDKR